MFIRTKQKVNGKTAIQIVESYRRANKVSQKIIRHIGQGATEREVAELKKLATSIIVELKNARQPVLPIFDPAKFYAPIEKSKQTAIDDKVKAKDLREEQRFIEGIGEVFGKLYTDLRFDHLLNATKKNAQWNGILKSCVLARIANPASKKRTASMLERDYAIKIPLEKIYRMMDHVAKQEERIKDIVCQSSLSLFKEQVDILFFDVTTLYFESTQADELKNFGFSKDCKFKEVQVVLALICTQEGLPISYSVYPGNLFEGHSLIDSIQELKERFNVKQVSVVADRAMFSEKNLEFMEQEGIEYIVAAKLKSMPKKLIQDILEKESYQNQEVTDEAHLVNEFQYKGRRLVVSYSAKRATKDATDRTRLVERLMKKSEEGKIKIKDLIPNYGTKKFINVTGGEVDINEDKIKAEEQWDGLHGVLTNSNADCAAILSRYRGLWQIEEAFRTNKHDLKMRPIFHWTPDRIKAHIAICFIAYALIKQSLFRLKKLSQAMSFERLREELLHVQASLYVDITTDKKYVIPSHVTVAQKKIYQAFGLKRSAVPYAL